MFHENVQEEVVSRQMDVQVWSKYGIISIQMAFKKSEDWMRLPEERHRQKR